MERLIGGTEIQLGLFPLSQDIPHSRGDLTKIVDQLISANNQTKLYGTASFHMERETEVCSRLFNGGLLYSDLSHLEYATPECSSLVDFPSYELGGRRIAESLLNLIYAGKKKVYSIFANNTDYQYQVNNKKPEPRLNTFAYHENYKSKDPNRKVDRLLPFLVTRQIFAGAGMVIPARLQIGQLDKMDYSLSQRALATSVWPTPKGLRVGSYSNAVGESRHIKDVLHITLGDANVSDYATKLKIGTTALVNQLLEDRWKMPNYLQLELPEALSNLRNIALYPNFGNFQKWHFHAGRYTISAIDVQRIYMGAATRYMDRDEDTDWTLLNWEITLDQLEQDPMSADKLDWVIKKRLIDKLKAKGFSEQELMRVDIGYHAADWKRSIFRLVNRNDTTDGQISHAINHAPSNTRAAGREIILRAIAQDKKSIEAPPTVAWDFIVYGSTHLNMPQPERTYLDEAQRFVRQLG